MKRREFLKATAALAAAAPVASRQIASVPAEKVHPPSPDPSVADASALQKFDEVLRPKLRKASHFFDDPDINDVFQRMLGAAYYRAADIGACLTIADQIIDGDRPSALRALLAAGDRLSAIAETSARNKLRVSAREAYMQAANYIFASTYFINPARRLPTPLLSTGCDIKNSGTKPPRYVIRRSITYRFPTRRPHCRDTCSGSTIPGNSDHF